MFSFRQKIFISYLYVFLLFLVLMFPFVTSWVHRIVFQAMESRVAQIISNIEDAPNNEALIKRLKDQKSIMFFRSSIISDEKKVLYDSHTKRLLGPKFSQGYVVSHPEVLEAFEKGVGHHEDYSQLLNLTFSYFAKSFDFHGKRYVLRTAFPYQYVMDITNDFEMGFLIFSSCLLLLFSLMTWFIIHRLTKPIQQIINAVKPYQDKPEAHLPAIHLDNLSPKDDFSKLALTLNSLSMKIQSHIDIITKERNEKEAILESLIEGVIAVDHQMKVAYANHMAFKLINFRNNLGVGEAFSSTGEEKCETLLRQCQEKNSPLTDTLEIFQEGKKLYLDIVAAPKKNHDGAILVLQDKTAHYKIFEMRRDFIANASHELKTPITVIRGFAEVLHDNPGLAQDIQEQMTSKIIRNCIRMTALIKDLLTLADIENIPSSRLTLCDIIELSERCIGMVHEVFPDANISIQKNHESVALVADADLLELAVMNLIENAAKYSSRPAFITVTLEDKEDRVIIQVSDKGIGIPETDQEHIFERFYTVDKAHSQKMGGSGLGLSIVKTIIEKHYGTISLQSTIGQGTTFTIEIPKRDVVLDDCLTQGY